MDDRHFLAEIERSLARDDPELAARITRLNRALDTPTDNPTRSSSRHSLRRDAIIPILVVVMFIAVIAALYATSTRQQHPTTPQPAGSAVPASESVPSR